MNRVERALSKGFECSRSTRSHLPRSCQRWRQHRQICSAKQPGYNVQRGRLACQHEYPTFRLNTCTRSEPQRRDNCTHSGHFPNTGASTHARQEQKIMAKFYCEGAELRIIPHLLQQQTLCSIDFATIEWHEKMLAAKWFHQSALARKIPTTRSGVLAATSMVNQTRVLIETSIQTTGSLAVD